MKNAFAVFVFLGFVCVAAFQNCGGPKSAGGSADKLSSTDEEAIKKELKGTWKQPCTFYPNFSTYYIQSISFSSAGSVFKITTTQKWYLDAACTSPHLTESQTRKVTSIELVDEGAQVDSQLLTQTLTMDNASTATHHNTLSTCGITDWMAGQARNTMNAPQCFRPGRVSDIFEITDGELYRALDDVWLVLIDTGTHLGATAYTKF